TISTRRVKAIQGGKPIFYLNASFQVEADGFEHQIAMPAGILPPEQLKSELELVRPYEQQIPPALRDKILCEKPIEIRLVALVDPIRPDVHEPLRHVWFKANGQMPDDQRVHKYLLAYASDFHFLFTALQPHGVSYWEPDMQ
ncbi:acyl-CoA thioesterase II, partial [Escherichia coli]